MTGKGHFDTSQVLEIGASRWKQWALVLAGIAMTGLCFAIALGVVGRIDASVAILGWIGTVFFGLALFVAIRSAITLRGAVLTLSPQGIRDVRIAGEFFPWGQIADISSWTNRSQKFVILKPDAELEARLWQGGYAKWMRRISKLLGANGIAITAQGLKTDYASLRDACEAYWHAHRFGSSPVEAGKPDEGNLENLLRRHQEVAVSEAVEEVTRGLAGHTFLVALKEWPEHEETISLLVAKDNRDLSWAYLYADEATIAGALEEGTPFARMTFEHIFGLVEGNPDFGGLSIHAGDQSYLLPFDYFERVRAVIDGGR